MRAAGHSRSLSLTFVLGRRRRAQHKVGNAYMAQAVTSFVRDAQVEAARVPPQSIEAEQSVLGGLLLDNAAWDRIADIVGEVDFYRADHRTDLQHIAQLIEENKPADALTVAESLERSGQARRGRRSGIPRLACGQYAERGKHPALRRDRARALDHAQPRRDRHRDRRFRLHARSARTRVC